jgi:hypothetical protein
MEKVIKTRVKLIYKSYQDWQNIAESFIPLNGEMCFCEVPATESVPKTVLFKVGDGTTAYANLPFGSALASDVYAWAKKENLEWDDLTQTFLDSLGAFIDEHYVHANTLYKIVKESDTLWKLQKSEDGGTTWVDAEGTVDISTAITALEDSLAAIAKTGNVNDLIQTTGDVLVFNCGSSTTVI